MTCIICNCKKSKIIWNDKIRINELEFSKSNHKIVQCAKCDTIQLKRKFKFLEDSSIARDLYNKDNSVKEFLKFHRPRDQKKIKFIEKFINFNNKTILESNCGSGIILEILKSKAKLRAGLDSAHYKEYLQDKIDYFFDSIDQIKKSKIRFDYILSFSELEHKFNPKKFLLDLKSILKLKGKLIIRVPNYENIYKNLCGYSFLKYDFRKSHNYYFTRKNLHFLFKKCGFKIYKEFGFNEYSFNHLLTYFNNQKRVKKNETINFINQKRDLNLVKHLEKNYLSTSIMYILGK